MAKRKDYFEPWRAAQPQQLTRPLFHDGVPPALVGTEALSLMQSAREKLVEQSDWLLWGSRMANYELAKSYTTGKEVVIDRERIIGHIRVPVKPDGSVGPQDLAGRVCECVNALAGIYRPESVLEDVRVLLRAVIDGSWSQDEAESLLARLTPEPIVEYDPSEVPNE